MDSRTLHLCLPSDKFHRLKDQLAAAVKMFDVAQASKPVTGLLQHATKVVRPGRPSLHQLYTLQNVGSHLVHHIRMSICLNAAARQTLLGDIYLLKGGAEC